MRIPTPKAPQLRRPTLTTVMSATALVVALGGTSYAAASINGKDIQRGTVAGKQIKNGSVKAKDLAPGVAGSGVAGATGAVGPAGAAGTGRWVQIGTDGQIVSQSGGFSVTSPYPTLPNTAVAPADNSARANGNVYINAGEPLTNNAITASLILQNTVDQNADGVTNGRAPDEDMNPEFSGQITVSKCNFTGSTPAIPTNCAPPGTNTSSTFVVSPRNANGTVTDTTTRKAFYVIIAGDSSDRTAP